MTLEQNITVILETYFSGFRDELIDACAQRIMEQIERQADTPQTEQTEPKKDLEITRNSLRSDCTGCRFVGWYDTEFPCVNCVRKNRDYYDSKI